MIAKNTLDAFVSLDPENKEYYQANYEQLTKEIGETERPFPVCYILLTIRHLLFTIRP